MCKLVVSAFDEAIVDIEEAIPTSTMLQLERIRKEGVLFAIATSRDLQTMLDYNRDFPFLDYLICHNGSYVYDVNNKEIIYEKHLGVRIVAKIKQLLEKYKLFFGTTDGLYRDDAILYECNDDIYKIEAHGKSKRDVMAIMRLLSASGMCLTFYERYRAGKFYVEITSGKNTKLTGVSKIARRNKISLKEVMAIGVEANDVALVEAVGNGISMANGCRDVRKVAKSITKSNLEKGVELAIKNNFKEE